MSKEAAQRALDIINHLGGAAEEFRRNWLTTHAFSSEFDKANQRHSLIAAIEASISDEKAQSILGDLDQQISYLKANPVGNLELSVAHPRFYQNARQDIAQVTLPDRSAANRLGHLVCVVYQVRCNTEHGRKQLGTARSQKLFALSNEIMKAVIPELIAAGAINNTGHP